MAASPPERVVHRLKAEGLVPADRPIRIDCPRSRTMVLSYKWQAVDAVTGESYHVGGTEPTKIMYRCTWTADRRDDGWTILTPKRTFERGGSYPGKGAGNGPSG